MEKLRKARRDDGVDSAGVCVVDGAGLICQAPRLVILRIADVPFDRPG